MLNYSKLYTEEHRFQNPNINLAKTKATLVDHLIPIPISEYFNGSIFLAIKVAAYYDKQKYSNMGCIPKLSRKQKAYNEYLKRMNASFGKLKLAANIKSDSSCLVDAYMKNTGDAINTIPEYLHYMRGMNETYNFRHIQHTVNNFKLSILYGYPVICGFELNPGDNQAVLIVGFDEKEFKIRRFSDPKGNTEQYISLTYEATLNRSFNPCVFFTRLGCDREINLGF